MESQSNAMARYTDVSADKAVKNHIKLMQKQKTQSDSVKSHFALFIII